MPHGCATGVCHRGVSHHTPQASTIEGKVQAFRAQPAVHGVASSSTHAEFGASIIHTYIHTHIPTYMHTCIHTCTHAYTHIHAHRQPQIRPQMVATGPSGCRWLFLLHLVISQLRHVCYRMIQYVCTTHVWYICTFDVRRLHARGRKEQMSSTAPSTAAPSTAAPSAATTIHKLAMPRISAPS